MLAFDMKTKRAPYHCFSNGFLGFTLVELLVVIAISAVLVALLISGVNNFLVKSGGTKSAANLRQIGALSMNYAADNDNKLPNGGSATPYFFLDVLYPMAYNGKSFPGFDSEGLSLKGTIFYSPNLKKSEPTPRRSYGWNGNVGTNTTGDTRIRYQLIESPAKVAMCGDSKQSSLLGTFTGTIANPSINFRNAGYANILFVDGHVESLKSEQIPQTTTATNFRTFWFVR